jgi:hypothetical protein
MDVNDGDVDSIDGGPADESGDAHQETASGEGAELKFCSGDSP